MADRALQDVKELAKIDLASLAAQRGMVIADRRRERCSAGRTNQKGKTKLKKLLIAAGLAAAFALPAQAAEHMTCTDAMTDRILRPVLAATR